MVTDIKLKMTIVKPKEAQSARVEWECSKDAVALISVPATVCHRCVCARASVSVYINI